MPSLSLTVRSLALAGFGLGAVPAFAQSANVTAFNPYNGVGAPGVTAAPGAYAQPQAGPAGGPAFNPWNPGASAGWGVAAAPPPTPYAGGAYAGGGYADRAGAHAPGANLPSPPPGPIESRLTAVPERPTGAASARTRAPATAAIQMPVAAPPAPEPVITRATPPAPTPTPTPIRTPVVASAPAPAAVVTPAPPPAPAVVAPAPARAAAVTVAPPSPSAAARSAPGPALASISFAPQSAEISGAARAELDRAAQSMKSLRQVELRAYAGGSEPTEARKIALARALSVRSYLIDQGVRSRIEVGAFASSGGGPGGERVDVLGP